ncbi:MAG: MFS transporter [Anaplasma sp.]
MWPVNRAFFAWFAVSLLYALQYIFRVIPNTLATEIMGRFGVGAFSLGQFSGLYYAGYTLAHIPLGVLMDRYGPKRVVSICAAMTFLGAVPMLFDSWILVQIGRVVTGIGSAAIALATFKVPAMYFGKKFARMTAIATIIGFLGAVYGGMPMLTLVKEFGWSSVFTVFIAVGCILALFSFWVLFDVKEETRGGSVSEQIKSVLCNKQLIIVSLFGGFMIGPLEGFADGWATIFLTEVCRIGQQSAAILPSTIFIGSCLGSFVLGYMFEKSYNAFSIIIYCGIFSIIAFAALLTGRCGTEVSTFALLFVVGFCSAYQLVTLCKAIGYVGKESVALATATSNMVIMIFGYFFHTVIAFSIDSHCGGGGVPVEYGSDLLVKSMLVVPLGTLVGTLGFMLLKYREARNARRS